MATLLGDDRYTFHLDWYDEQAGIIRKYFLYYLNVTNTIEMYDVKNQRIFLKRMEIPGLALDDLFVGAKVTILSRSMKVTDYGDVRTKHHFEANRTCTFA